MSKRGCDAAAEARYDRRGAAHLLCAFAWGLDAPVQKALRMWDKDALQDVNLQHHSLAECLSCNITRVVNSQGSDIGLSRELCTLIGLSTRTGT